jgi:iron(III) transport system ATP-binding protein
VHAIHLGRAGGIAGRRSRRVHWAAAAGLVALVLVDTGLVAVIGLPSIVLAAGFVFFYDLPPVALARALVARPAVLLCDEPLSHLDANLRERLRAEIAVLAGENETTVLYITHDQVEAFALADRVGVLQAGRLVQCAPPELVYHAPLTPFVARFTGIAGELQGRIAGAAETGGRLRVETPNGPLLAAAPGDEPLKSAVTVLIRPSATHLVPTTDEGGLLGRVRDVAYRGVGYDHQVQLADGTNLAGVFAEQRRRPGEQVRVRLAPDRCFAYRAPDLTC